MWVTWNSFPQAFAQSHDVLALRVPCELRRPFSDGPSQWRGEKCRFITDGFSLERSADALAATADSSCIKSVIEPQRCSNCPRRRLARKLAWSARVSAVLSGSDWAEEALVQRHFGQTDSDSAAFVPAGGSHGVVATI